jgi:hypothetical protein
MTTEERLARAVIIPNNTAAGDEMNCEITLYKPNTSESLS